MALATCWLGHLQAGFRSSAPIANLGHTLALAQCITVMPHDDLPALVTVVVGLRDRQKAADILSRLRTLIEKRSHGQYGRRYAEQIAADFGLHGCSS